MSKPLTTSEFLAKLRGQKIKIVPQINVQLEDGGSIVIEADCSGCNNANQHIVYTPDQDFPKRWNEGESAAE